MPSAAGTPRMKVVCFGQQNWDYCWTAKQQICVRLGSRGHPVLYVDPDSIEEPLGVGDTLRALAPARTGYRVREEAPGVRLYTHVHAPPLRWRLNQALRAGRLSRIADRLDMRGGVALAIHPAARMLMDAVRPRARIYYAVDEMTAFHRDDATRRRMRREEDLIIRASDAVIGVSPRLHERFARVHPNAHLVQNAADVAHFDPAHLAAAPVHPALRDAKGPTLALVGQIDERVDQGLLVHIARARPGWRIVLAGRVKQGVDVSALEAEPSIRLLGYQEYRDLPSVLVSVDVCMVPYHLTPLTHGCNPLKAWEYLATGRPVVASPLNALLPMRDLITLADTPAAFVDALDAALADPARGRDLRLAFARENSWEARVDELEKIFADAVERAAARAGGAAPRVAGVTLAAETLAADPLTPRRRRAFRVTRAVGRVAHLLRRASRTLLGRPGRVRTILVARRSRLGDTVVLLPTLRALRAHYPGARVVLGVQKGFNAHAMVAGVVDEVRDIDVLENPSRFRGLLDMAKLFAAGFDLVVCGASYFMLREAWLTGAPLIAGLDDGQPMQTLNDVRVRVLPASHEVDNNLAIVEALGADVTDGARVPQLSPPAGAEERVRRVRAELGVPAHARMVLLHPGSQKPSRRWPAERFVALTAGLLAEHADVHAILTGIPDEADLVAGVHDALPAAVRPRAHDAVGRTSLEDLLALLSEADVFVCNDTGTMHAARALGTPLLALLGPENDLRWGPYPLGPSAAISLRAEVPCAPCVRWTCEPLYCLREVSVADALAGVRDLLERRVAGAGVGASLDRRAAPLGWQQLHGRGHPLPRIAVMDLADAGAIAGSGFDIDVVPVAPGATPAEAAASILEASNAPFIATTAPARRWTPEALSTCLAALIREDDAVAAAPETGGYRSVDAAAALRTGGVLLRRACLERIVTMRPGDETVSPAGTVAEEDAVAR